MLAVFFLAVSSATGAVKTPGPKTPAPSAPAVAPAVTPTAAPAPDARKLSYTVFHINAKAVALTFNDGPHPKNTPRLLDILKEHGVKATFFLIGKSVEANPQIVKRITDEGHEVGNATWSHKGLRSLSDERALEELQKAHDAIVAASAVAPRIYRPPFGAVSNKQEAFFMERLHYTTIKWELDTNDWKSPRTVEKVHDSILKDAHAGTIILCHDIHEATVDAMPTTLDEMKAKGFEFHTISEMIKIEEDEVKATKAPIAATPPTAPPTAPPPSTPAPVSTTPTPASPTQPAKAAEVKPTLMEKLKALGGIKKSSP